MRQPELQSQYMAETLMLCTASYQHLLQASCCPFVKSLTGKLNYPLVLHYHLLIVKEPSLKIGIVPLTLGVPHETATRSSVYTTEIKLNSVKPQ